MASLRRLRGDIRRMRRMFDILDRVVSEYRGSKIKVTSSATQER